MKNYSKLINSKFLALILIFYFLVAWLPVYGREASSSSQEATLSAEKNIQQILEAVRERIQEKQSALKRRAYVGTLKSIAESTLIIKTKNGIKQANVSSKSAIIRISSQTKKKIKFEDLVIGDFTIAMGYLDKNKVLDTKRVVVSKKHKQEPKKEAIYGIVNKVNLKKKVVKIKEVRKEKEWNFKITNKTTVFQKTNGRLKKVSFKEIEAGSRLVTAGILEKDGIVNARRILLLSPIH